MRLHVDDYYALIGSRKPTVPRVLSLLRYLLPAFLCFPGGRRADEMRLRRACICGGGRGVSIRTGLNEKKAI